MCPCDNPTGKPISVSGSCRACGRGEAARARVGRFASVPRGRRAQERSGLTGLSRGCPAIASKEIRTKNYLTVGKPHRLESDENC